MKGFRQRVVSLLLRSTTPPGTGSPTVRTNSNLNSFLEPKIQQSHRHLKRARTRPLTNPALPRRLRNSQTSLLPALPMPLQHHRKLSSSTHGISPYPATIISLVLLHTIQ